MREKRERKQGFWPCYSIISKNMKIILGDADCGDFGHCMVTKGGCFYIIPPGV